MKNRLSRAAPASLGEALMRSLEDTSHEATGLDIQEFAVHSLRGIDRGSAASSNSACKVWTWFYTRQRCHKPQHCVAHTRQDFVDTNISGTLNLLEEAVSAGVKSFVFTSTTSVFGHALTPPSRCAGGVDYGGGRNPSPKTSMALQKLAAENLCQTAPTRAVVACIRSQDVALFPEDDDNRNGTVYFDEANLKVNEVSSIGAQTSRMSSVPHVGDAKWRR